MAEMKEVAPNIYLLKIPVPLRVRNINAYIFRGQKPTLIDTGTNTPGVYEMIQTALKRLEIKHVEQVILTHWHVDHSGIARQFAEQGARVLIGLKDYTKWGKFVEGKGGDLYRDWALKEWEVPSDQLIERMNKAYGNPRQKMTTLPDHIDEIIPMEMLPAGDYQLQAIPTPGHTKGHFAFFENQGKRLFTGDMLLPDMISFPDIWCEECELTSGLVSHLKSLDTMEKLNADEYFPSHGKPQLNPSLRCQETRSEILEQAEKYDPTCSVFENAVRLNHGTDNLEGLFMRLHYVFGWKQIFEQTQKDIDAQNDGQVAALKNTGR